MKRSYNIHKTLLCVQLPRPTLMKHAPRLHHRARFPDLMTVCTQRNQIKQYPLRFFLKVPQSNALCKPRLCDQQCMGVEGIVINILTALVPICLSISAQFGIWLSTWFWCAVYRISKSVDMETFGTWTFRHQFLKSVAHVSQRIAQRATWFKLLTPHMASFCTVHAKDYGSIMRLKGSN